MSLIDLTPKQLRQAANLVEKIEGLRLKLSRLHADGASVAAASAETPARRGKRKMSAAGLAAIRAGQKARWAKAKATTAVVAPVKRGRRKMSAAGRAKIAAAAKARWAKVRAAKGA